MSTTPTNTPAAVKPTILAFHGSGSNATIHAVQLARLNRLLKERFEVVSLDAPFPSPAGPGILPFFDGCGPYKRWLPATTPVSLAAMRSGSSTHRLSDEASTSICEAARGAHERGSCIVGVLGFSQGTKVVAGLLRACEMLRALEAQSLAGRRADADADGEGKGEAEGEAEASAATSPETATQPWKWLSHIRFGISICASYPPPLVPGAILAALETSGLDEAARQAWLERRITVPTFHVLGTQDEWSWAGRGMIEGHFEVGEGKSRVEEWEMGHHYPAVPEQSEAIRDWIWEVWGTDEAAVQ